MLAMLSPAGTIGSCVIVHDSAPPPRLAEPFDHPRYCCELPCGWMVKPPDWGWLPSIVGSDWSVTIHCWRAAVSELAAPGAWNDTLLSLLAVSTTVESGLPT